MEPYGFPGLLVHHRTNANMLRKEWVGQPKTLKPGDIWATGDRVLEVRDGEGGKSGLMIVRLKLFAEDREIEFSVHPHFPIALLTEESDIPEEMRALLKKQT